MEAMTDPSLIAELQNLIEGYMTDEELELHNTTHGPGTGAERVLFMQIIVRLGEERDDLSWPTITVASPVPPTSVRVTGVNTDGEEVSEVLEVGIPSKHSYRGGRPTSAVAVPDPDGAALNTATVELDVPDGWDARPPEQETGQMNQRERAMEHYTTLMEFPFNRGDLNALHGVIMEAQNQPPQGRADGSLPADLWTAFQEFAAALEVLQRAAHAVKRLLWGVTTATVRMDTGETIPSPPGACCYPDGTCIVETFDTCATGDFRVYRRLAGEPAREQLACYLHLEEADRPLSWPVEVSLAARDSPSPEAAALL